MGKVVFPGILCMPLKKNLKGVPSNWREVKWTIVNKKDTIFKYIFWERLDSLPIPECCFHFIWC